MDLVGKNAFRRIFKELLAKGQDQDYNLGLLLKPTSQDDIAISIRGNDVGAVYWPVMLDEDQRWLLASEDDLKSELDLKLTRKNPKHVAWFKRDSFTSTCEQTASDVCNEMLLRDIIKNTYVQSPIVQRRIELQVGERGKRLSIARQLGRYQKEWRRRISLSDKECCE